MAQTKDGATKIAAQKIGVSVDEYKGRIADDQKWCYRCKSWKHTSRFNVDQSRWDKLAARCVECVRVKTRKQSHGGPSTKKEAQAAVDAVRHAIKRGRLAKVILLPCVDCGGTAHHYHHHLGYAPTHRLDVIALCRSCHKKRHVW